MTDTTTLPTPALLDDDGRLLPVWGFLAFHHGLRRDAGRFVAAATAIADGGGAPERVTGLQEHWRYYRALLEFHHENEDAGMFPLLRDRYPELAPVIDRLDAEHHELSDLLHRLSDLVERLPEPDVVGAAQEAFVDLRRVLEPHLATEEEHLVPKVLQFFAEDPEAGPPPQPESNKGDPDTETLMEDDMLVWSVDGLDPAALELVLEAWPEPLRSEYPQRAERSRAAFARWT